MFFTSLENATYTPIVNKNTDHRIIERGRTYVIYTKIYSE